ncbi:sn-1-specific diacylglycerol lipase ABHD11 isoform X3 [Homo sapiens]|uniref:sn-1-specific diacylglycerol lipase ABHD11 isoform X3 n=1 Tax=Homo sapiens TaxID=9606 RepID=UPI0001948486|nr:protein ABHD11 isoform X3 [Homo sapiens]XP_054215093.1 protein ABHD11 isoform X3 [Homo sapiens]
MRAGQQLASMLRWTRAWRLPREGLGPHGPSFARVPVAPSSSSGGRGGAEPRPLPLSYRLLDGEAALPAVVFLHGLFGSKTNFNSIAKILAQQTGRRISIGAGPCLGACTLSMKGPACSLGMTGSSPPLMAAHSSVLLLLEIPGVSFLAFSEIATQPGQPFRDVVTTLGPALLWQSGPRFFIWAS